ncbi:protein transport protein Sec31A [Ostrinia nubilalis]|uniref:protein transport protein Sec31A n=1 Tax=Ostrinia nubilalis TaxID=29057 RepID=UPI0030823FA9
MKLKELKKTVNISWSPAGMQQVLLAAGSAAQQVDSSFSSSSQLELYALNLDDPGMDLELKSSVTTQHKFQKLVWSDSGILVGGCDGGLLEFYNADKLLSNASDALVGSSTKHSGQVSALDINPYQKNLLASGASESEIFIWDLNNTSQPMAPGNRSQPPDHVQGLAWNQQVQHILGSTFATRCVVWDLRKNEPIMKLSDATSRTRWRSLAWHPGVATQLCVASEDDQAPVLQLWDLRLAASPLLTLEGHQKGALALSWSRHDPDMLLSAGKDGRILCWNPNNTAQPGGELVMEVGQQRQWVFEARWCPRAPGLLAAASFDQQLAVHTVLPTSRPEVTSQSQNNIMESFGGLESFSQLPAVQREPQNVAQTPRQLPQPSRAPAWLRRPVAAKFAFGGKLVTFEKCPQEAGPQKMVYVSQVVSDPEVIEKAAQLDAALGPGLTYDPQNAQHFAEYCRARGDAASEQHERYTWFFLRANFLPNFREEVLNLLGFKQDDIPSKFKSNGVPGDGTQPDVAALSRGESTETEAELSTDTSTDLSDATTLIERKLANVDIGTAVTNVVIPNGEDPTSLICRALICGNLEEAVELCLDASRVADALIIASLGSQELLYKVQKYHLKQTASDPVSLISGSLLQSRWDTLVQSASPRNWRDTLAAIVTHCDGEALAHYCEMLGDKLSAESEPALKEAASLCYLCAMSPSPLAALWARRADAAERVLLAGRAAAARGRQWQAVVLSPGVSVLPVRCAIPQATVLSPGVSVRHVPITAGSARTRPSASCWPDGLPPRGDASGRWLCGDQASLCYLCAMSPSPLAALWARRADAAERVLLAGRAAAARGRQWQNGDKLEAVLVEYASRLAAQGCLQSALSSLEGLAHTELRERLERATGLPRPAAQVSPAAQGCLQSALSSLEGLAHTELRERLERATGLPRPAAQVSPAAQGCLQSALSSLEGLAHTELRERLERATGLPRPAAQVSPAAQGCLQSALSSLEGLAHTELRERLERATGLPRPAAQVSPAAQGCLQSALSSLEGLAHTELRERLERATGLPRPAAQQLPGQYTRNRTVSSHSQKRAHLPAHSDNNSYGGVSAPHVYQQPWNEPPAPAAPFPPQPPRPGSVGPQSGGLTSRSKYKVDPSVQSAPLYNQYSFNNPAAAQPYGYNSPLPDQYSSASVPNPGYAPVTNPVNSINPPPLNPINPPSLNPVNTAPLNPMNPAPLNPLNTAPLNPMNPAPLNPMNPAPLNPMNPAPLNPMNPGINPVNQGNQNGYYQESAAPVKPAAPGWNDPPMLTSKPKPKQEVQAQAPITHPLFGVEPPQHIPLAPNNQYPGQQQYPGQAYPGQQQSQVYPGQQQNQMYQGQQPVQPYPGQQYAGQPYPGQQATMQYQDQMNPAFQGGRESPAQPAVPPPAPVKAPIPEQYAAMVGVFDALRNECYNRANNPQMKRKLEDVQRRLETLYDMLREHRLSENALSTLQTCASLAARADTEGAAHAVTSLAAGAEFAAVASFLPALKGLLQLAQHLQVQLQ